MSSKRSTMLMAAVVALTMLSLMVSTYSTVLLNCSITSISGVDLGLAYASNGWSCKQLAQASVMPYILLVPSAVPFVLLLCSDWSAERRFHRLAWISGSMLGVAIAIVMAYLFGLYGEWRVALDVRTFFMELFY